VRDLNRAQLTRLVYQHLTDPEFRSRVNAESAAGERPIVVALRDDVLGDLIDRIRHDGGSCNVVYPALNGFVVLAMTVGPATVLPVVDDEAAAVVQGPLLKGDCTLGVLFERLRLDIGASQEMTYQVVGDGEAEKVEQGRAEVVALGG
jgi:hypothetical protein